MVIVKIASGPRAGQQNLDPMWPTDLFLLAQEGWRWQVDWKTVTDAEAFEWGRNDLMAKVVSALVRGGEVRFLDQVWQTTTPSDVMVVAQQVEDYVSEAGFNVAAGEDTERHFVIETGKEVKGL